MHFFGEVPRAEALGLKREDRPAAFAGRSEWLLGLGYLRCLPEKVSYPFAKRSLKLRSGKEAEKISMQSSHVRRVQRA